MTDPLTEDEKYVAAWHHLQAAKRTLPASGSVSTGPALAFIEKAQDEVTERRELLHEVNGE